LWDKTLKGEDEDKCGTIKGTPDSHYIIVGTQTSFEKGGTAVFLAKIDDRGQLVWRKSYADLGIRGGSDVIVLKTGGYVFLGKSISTKPSANDDIVVVKTDDDGNVLWHTTIGGKGNEEAFSIVATSDREYVLTGYTNSRGYGATDVYVVKLNENGKVVWERTFGGNSLDGGLSLACASDDGVVIAGACRSFGRPILKTYLLKVNQRGELMWSRLFRVGNRQEGRSVAVCPDGGYVVASYTRRPRSSQLLAYIIKTDENGLVASYLPDMEVPE
jgi:hypothetical protein